MIILVHQRVHVVSKHMSCTCTHRHKPRAKILTDRLVLQDLTNLELAGTLQYGRRWHGTHSCTNRQTRAYVGAKLRARFLLLPGW